MHAPDTRGRRRDWLRLTAGLAAWWKRYLHLTPEIDFVDANVGGLLVLANDSIVSRTIRRTGVWETGHLAVFARMLAAGDTAIDIGANIGHHTVAMARMVGPTGHVLAFEPQAFVYRILVANLAINRADHVEAFPVALGETPAHAWMAPHRYDDRNEHWNVGGLSVTRAPESLPPGSTAARVRIERLDDLLGDREAAFIKSDAQGCDCFALRGGRGLLERSRPTILTEIAPRMAADQGCDYRDLYELLESLGYRFFDPQTFAETPARREWSGDPHEEWDVLAVHPSRVDRLVTRAREQPGRGR